MKYQYKELTDKEIVRTVGPNPEVENADEEKEVETEKKEFMKHRNFDDDEYEPIANIEKMMLDDRRPPYEVILNIIFSEQNIKTKSLYNDLYNPLLSFNIDFTSLLDKNHNQEYEFLMDLKKNLAVLILMKTKI
nr:13086_t:CDS:2 [Entrophospora candida]